MDDAFSVAEESMFIYYIYRLPNFNAVCQLFSLNHELLVVFRREEAFTIEAGIRHMH
jgi:hypothetical protein